MSRASCRAVAKTATAPPLWRAIRRKEAPRAVLDRWSEVAAIRRTPPMRLAPRPLRRFLPETSPRGNGWHESVSHAPGRFRDGGEAAHLELAASRHCPA